ncbi:hypothetical protein RD110_10755 [Rhodoferax koreense]|uniref:Uncharacterized protein n=1 Tax=Rhodoferax koreensis TaxID=1842727 RepID=A0A1P8JV08_9BURK|nr:hypothetical protein [Rhodoferax koreense]APW37606.1 hypothetical protein RD110_10755 [Rhodoferax koreense]
MNENRTAIQPCAQPGRASVEDGFVLLDGPDGVAVTMTADAAAQTAESLRQAALQAKEEQPSEAGSDEDQVEASP